MIKEKYDNNKNEKKNKDKRTRNLDLYAIERLKLVVCDVQINF